MPKARFSLRARRSFDCNFSAAFRLSASCQSARGELRLILLVTVFAVFSRPALAQDKLELKAFRTIRAFALPR